MKKVEQYEAIRRDHKNHGLSIRELARKYKVHRRDVRQALASAVPPPAKSRRSDAPKLGPHKELIRSWLIEDKRVPPKQRHTSRRVWQRLVDEKGADLAEGTVRSYVALVRKELSSDIGEVAIVQQHTFGEEAEVDFGEFSVWLRGSWTKLNMFVMRLPASGKAFHIAFGTCGQEAFLSGHVRAFEYFGGVPGRIRYDNLKPAVTTVLLGRERLENERFVALRSHYGFDSFYCIPGIKGAHEKGGVEGEIGRFRRNHLVPVPRVDSLAELNIAIAAGDVRDDGRHIASRRSTVGEDFARESKHLSALPVDSFDTTTVLSARVDAKARVSVKRSLYSVPARYAGKSLTIRVGVDEILAFDAGAEVARHERALSKGEEHYVLDHYLEVLKRKPGALAGSVALDQARKTGVFTDVHDRFWREARERLGDQKGTKAIIEVLLLHRELDAEVVVAGMQRALSSGSVDPVIVGIEARCRRGPGDAEVIPITASRFDRPAPNVDDYDNLLEVTK